MLSLIGRGRWRDQARGKCHSRIRCASVFSSSCCCSCPSDHGYGQHPVVLGPSCEPRANAPSSELRVPASRVGHHIPSCQGATPNALTPLCPPPSPQPWGVFPNCPASLWFLSLLAPRATFSVDQLWQPVGSLCHPAGCGEAHTFSREAWIPFGGLWARDAGPHWGSGCGVVKRGVLNKSVPTEIWAPAHHPFSLNLSPASIWRLQLQISPKRRLEGPREKMHTLWYLKLL